MSKKAGIWIGVVVVVLALGAWVGMTFSAIMSDSSKAEEFLKGALANHTVQAEVSPKLREMGFEMTDSPGSSTGNGPTHSLLVYSSHVTVNLTFDKDSKLTAYHLDKG